MLSGLGGALSGIVHGVTEGVGNVAGAVTKGVAGLGSAGSVPLIIEVQELKLASSLEAYPKMLLAVSRGCCDYSSRLKGPSFNATTGTIAGGS